MPGGHHQNQGEQHAQKSSMPRASSMPLGGAACPKEQHAQGKQHAPGRKSMPWGGAACPREEQHAPGGAVERVAWPEGVACSGKQYAKGGAV
jgi:hypothetical protein